MSESNSHSLRGGEYFLRNMQKKLNTEGLIVVKVGNEESDVVIVPKKTLAKELTIHGNTLKQLHKMDDFEKNNEILKNETARVIREADNSEKWKEFPQTYKSIAYKLLDNIVV